MNIPNKDSNFILSKERKELLTHIVKLPAGGLRNILLIGPTGCGKTDLARWVAAEFQRPYYEAMVGQCSEPLDLLGAKGVANGATFFKESKFVSSIETKDSVVCLDEINRCTPNILNMLIPLLDHRGSVYVEELERYVNVAEGVTFVATANIGTQFSGTYRFDEAIVSRFAYQFEVSFLEEEDEAKMLISRTGIDEENANMLAKVGATLRSKAVGFGGTLTRLVSTRQLIATAQLIASGVTIHKALSATIVPSFDAEDGASSERKQVIDTIQLICG